MALQIWLPLNGDIRNQGLDSREFSSSNISVSDGKLGKSIYFPSAAEKHAIVYSDEVTFSKNFSLSCFALLSKKTSSNVGTLIMNGRAGNEAIPSGTYSGWWLYYSRVDTPVLKFRYAMDVFDICPLEYDTWYHIAITMSETKEFKAYINGKYIAEHSYANKPDHTRNPGYTNFSVGNFNTIWTVNHYGKMQDVRVYDNCLTADEVKELARGLCLHYPLCQPERAPNLIGPENWKQTGWTGSITPNDAEPGVYTLMAGSGWHSMYISGLDGIQKSITISADFRVRSDHGVWERGDVTVHFGYSCTGDQYIGYMSSGRVSIWSNATSLGGSTCITGYHEFDTWYHWTHTFTISDSKELCAMCVNIGGAQTDKQSKVDLRNVYMTYGKFSNPTFSPYSGSTPNWSDGVERDTSGFGNNGTVTGHLPALVQDCPTRNRGSYEFNGDTYVGNIPNTISSDAAALSFSCWVKSDISFSSSTVYFGLFSNRGTGPGVSLWLKKTRNVRFDCGNLGIETSAKELYDGEWHFLAGTYTKSTEKALYIDGKQVLTQTGADSITGMSDIMNIGQITIVGTTGTPTLSQNRMHGCVSDFRLYASALSQADIQEIMERTRK